MKKIPSFTIMELAITLLISSVVISSGYYAYSLIHHQFDRYRERAVAMDQFQLLSRALSKDFDRSISVCRGADSQLICRWSDTLIGYTFLKNCVLRTMTGGVRDSFSMKVTIKDFLYLDDSLPLISSVRMEVAVSGEPILLSARKVYSSQEILTAEEQRDKTDSE